MDLTLSKLKVTIIVVLLLMLGFSALGLYQSNRSQALSECSVDSGLYDSEMFTSAEGAKAHAACSSTLQDSTSSSQ